MSLTDLKNAGVANTPACNALKNNKNNKFNKSYIPKKGDVLFLVNPPSSTYIARHVGIVESVTYNKDGYRIVTAIEGNVNGTEYTSQPYFKTSKVSRVEYIYTGGQYIQLDGYQYVKGEGQVPKLNTDRKILGFYPTSLYN